MRLFTRPEDIQILPEGELSQNEIAAQVEEVAYLGDHFEYHIQAGGISFVLPAAKKARYTAGSEVRLSFDPRRIHVHSREAP